ncbi:MFS general substrate transporter [Pluteus cervinus]|uniref:MFS general substrate transporter n=1 Tax=Pluteus cervinus TaxID=181527 RepID=A0ACD3A9P3_9AGAR|nr:MFS general substrate transporter [Pluteus cervinus]
MTTQNVDAVVVVSDIDERTPLLHHHSSTSSPSPSPSSSRSSPKKPRTPTPLPRLQIAIVLVLQVCEPLASQSILPYINQLVGSLDITGGDPKKIGYYAGLIESLFFATEALCVLQWSRLSDHVGRKPVLLIGLAGTAISMIFFGLSQTFWGLVLSRCLCGLLNGNIGVMKSVMGELTDSSNRAEGFALMPVVWATGATFGPLLGGTLSKPADRFPRYFDNSFWREYPYLLPCVAAASFIFVAFVVTACVFKETVPKRKSIPRRSASTASDHTMVESSPSDEDDKEEEAGPLPLRQLLVYPVILSVSNYVTLAFLNIGLISLLPLFFSMPLSIGGLGFDPPTIGYIMGAYGAGTGIYQALYFSKIIKKLGPRLVFVSGMATFMPVFVLIPVMSVLARWNGGVYWVVWVLIGVVMSMMAWMDMAYGCIFMYVTGSAPNKRSLGATNGLSQTSVSVARAIGPALFTSLFSFSLEEKLMGGYAVYVILFVMSVAGMGVARMLPVRVWDDCEEEGEEEA